MTRFEQRPYRRRAGVTEIVLVRHGASEAAVEGSPFPLVDGRGDPPLSALGKRQGSAVAQRLRDERPSRIFVTPLRRTSETAAPLLAESGGDQIVVAELTEVMLGELEGGRLRIRAAAGDGIVARIFSEERWDVVPGAESAARFGSRVRAGVDRIAVAGGPDATVAAFTHRAVIAELCHQATGSRPFAFANAENGSISRLLVSADGSWSLRSFNEVAHLPAQGSGLDG